MASLLSHELNQPLAAISSYATGSMNLLKSPAAPGALPDIEVAMRAHRRTGRARRQGDQERARLRAPARQGARAGHARRRLLDAILPLVSLQARKLGRAGRHAREERPACRAVRPHHGRAGAAQPGAQCHAGHGPGRCGPPLAGDRGDAGTEAGKGWLEFSVTDMRPGHCRRREGAAVHAVLHHQVGRHGPGPVAVPHRGRAAWGIPRVRAQPAARYDFPVHPAGRTPATCNLP